MIKHFSLIAWGPALSRTYGDVNLLYVSLDWLRGVDDHQPWFSLGAGLLGFCAYLTFWPQGKRA